MLEKQSHGVWLLFGIYMCLILEVWKFAATSELRIFDVDLNRSSWRKEAFIGKGDVRDAGDPEADQNGMLILMVNSWSSP